MSTKGITQTSALVTISGQVQEAVAGTLVQEEVALNLDILGREVFLVYAVDLNIEAPDAIIGVNTQSLGSLSTTSRSTIGNLQHTNVLAAVQKDCRAGVVAFHETSPDSPPTSALSYIGIISTNNFFVQTVGQNNINTQGTSWRVWGARAKVTADIYAALVQSETLSA